MASQIEKGINAIQKEVKNIKDRLEKFIKELSKIGKTKVTKKAPSKKAPVKKAAVAKKTAPAKKKPAPKKKPVKKTAAAKQTAGTGTAFALVVDLIHKSEAGIDTKTLMEKTGFDFKKISNIVFKARNKGLIKSVKKGIYEKA